MFNDAPDGHDRSDEPVSSTPRAASAPRAAAQLIGRSPELLSVLSLMERVAPSSCTVLITGESGTGKEVVVAALHEQSPRRAAPLVTINCGAIPEQLLEIELFGHARGAFTGAHAARPGRVQAAEGGTLFLDEVGDLPLGLQVKLLRLLQQREYSPVGDNRTVKCDIRVVAATNRDLGKEVAEGRFREDLYYRLDVIHLELPPLRDRPGDVALLAEHFLGVCAERAGRGDLQGFSPEALALLEVYEWPGNVRALENAVERAVLLSAGPLIAVADLPPAIRACARKIAPALAPTALGADLGLREAVERFENQLIMQALERTGWNKQRAAQLLQVNRTTLVEMLKRKKICAA
jgi:sigma-54 specific flagellar transcriptional regulator A